jgi:SAM-dependent methyltransferase
MSHCTKDRDNPYSQLDWGKSELDNVEILSVDLLDRYRTTVSAFEELSRRVRHELGWHYLLDLSWTWAQIEKNVDPGATILDAGAGFGLCQWFLAERGYRVISVDTRDRGLLPIRFRENYRIKGLRPTDYLESRVTPQDFRPSRNPREWYRWPVDVAAALKRAVAPGSSDYKGEVVIYDQNLNDLQDISDDSVDAVVSISALEHNTHDNLRDVVAELTRVVKPGGIISATLGAAKEEDWLHEPSHGWCYTDESLRELFNLSKDFSSNFDRFDEFFQSLKNSTELKEKLGSYYRRPGNHGMPSGRWDPEYQVVGVVKGC